MFVADGAHGVCANYYLDNRGKVGLLLCQAMELSFRVSSRYGTESFPLIAASGEGTHADFTLLDPPDPAPRLVGSTVASRSVSLPADALGRLRDMQEQIPKMMAEAEIVGRVVDSRSVGWGPRRATRMCESTYPRHRSRGGIWRGC